MAMMPSSVPSPIAAATAIARLLSSSKPRGDLFEDLQFAAEMPVGRGGGDAGDAAGIGEGKIFRAALLDEPSRRVDQRFAQFAVMIARFSAHLVDTLSAAGRHAGASRGIEKLAPLTFCDGGMASIC